jgi:predicted porin
MEMIGGFMKTTSRFALVAAAGLLLGAAYTPAKAADLGGGCCADLEERVAELEATTARKGNRVVSLQVYGQVNKALLIWDDGVDSDAYVVDNNFSSSRIGLKGEAKISANLTAGYRMEFDVNDSASEKVSQADDGDNEDVMSLRHNYMYIDSKQLGRISIGHQSTVADGATEVVLGNSLSNSRMTAGNGMTIRGTGGIALRVLSYGGLPIAGGLVGPVADEFGTAGAVTKNLDGGRADLIRYDSPSIMGFILSASWGENDYTDVALRFVKEFNSIRVAAGIGYVWADELGAEELAGSASVMHVPTGLYAAFAAADLETEGGDDIASMWYVQGGIEKKLLPYGTTTIYGEYGEYTSNDVMAATTLATLGSFAITDYVPMGDVETTRIGFGLVQKIDAAAMDVYVNANIYSFDDENPTNDLEDLTTIMVGSRIKF